MCHSAISGETSQSVIFNIYGNFVERVSEVVFNLNDLFKFPIHVNVLKQIRFQKISSLVGTVDNKEGEGEL